MSEYPELLSPSDDQPVDSHLFRIGAYQVYANIGSIGKLAIHTVSVHYGSSGIPTAELTVGIGEPVGPGTEFFKNSKASFSSIKKGETIEIYLVALNPTSDVESISLAFEPGEYLMFKGIVSGKAVHRDESSRDVSLKVYASHKAGLILASNTTIFGAFAPGARLDMSRMHSEFEIARLIDIELSDGAELLGPIKNGLNEVFETFTEGDDRRNSILDTFESFKSISQENLTSGLGSLSGNLPLKSTLEGSSAIAASSELSVKLSNKIQQGIQSTNALALLMNMASYCYFNVFGLSSGLYAFPYWPYRKSDSIKSLQAGSLILISQQEDTISSRGAVIGGAIAEAPTIGAFSGGSPQHEQNSLNCYKSAYKWSGLTEAERTFATIDFVQAPDWLIYSHAPDGDTVDKESRTTPVPMHNSESSEIEKKEKLHEGSPLSSSVLDDFTKFYVWEQIVASSKMRAILPLRKDIVPGMPIRIENRSSYDQDTTSKSDATYAYVDSVTIRINAIANVAGTTLNLTHVRDNETQELFEDNDGPFAYTTDFYSEVDALELFDE